MTKNCSFALLYFVSALQSAAVQHALVAEWHKLYSIMDTRDTCAQ